MAQVRYERAFLIYNPRAGKLLRHQGQLLQRIIGTLESRGHKVTPLPTTGPHTAGGLARQAIEQSADVVLVAGGDGTINETIQGMAGSQVPLGIVPVGTANVLGCELKIKGGPPGAARALETWVARPVELGKLTNRENPKGRYFLLMAGAGLDAHIVYRVNSQLKQRLGKLAYWVAGFGQFGRQFPEFEAAVNGTSLTCTFALASRVRNYGGDLEIARGASLLGSGVEIVLFQGRQSWVFMKYFAGVLAGQHHRMKGVTVAQGMELQLDCPADPRIYIQVDGEFAGNLPARISVASEPLKLLVPPPFAALNG